MLNMYSDENERDAKHFFGIVYVAPIVIYCFAPAITANSYFKQDCF